jgi:hypothetical protein
LHPPNAIYGFRVDTVDPNPSRAGGTPIAGWIDSAINRPDVGTMYVGFLAQGETPNTEDWGILTLINVIEGAGRRFEIAPGFAGACRVYTEGALPRLQVGDLSKQQGGPFPPHRSHQSGVDADVRYLRDDGEGPMNFREHADSIHYDLYRTVDLMRCFMTDPRVQLILLDTALAGIANDGLSAGRLVHDTAHFNHFHVRTRAY